MTKIKLLADEVMDEVCGAKWYAEKYIEYKAKNNSMWANRFEEMAEDELKHASYLHDLVVAEIEELSSVYKPPQKMLDKWEKCHTAYVEKAAWVKQMLTM